METFCMFSSRWFVLEYSDFMQKVRQSNHFEGFKQRRAGIAFFAQGFYLQFLSA